MVSLPNCSSYLIVASSGRALAQAAVRAGARVHVVDCFGDEDTRACARSVERIASLDGSAGSDPGALRMALGRLEARYGAMPVIPGSGFEACPHVLKSLACDGYALIGNAVATLRRVKDPAIFFRAVRELGFRHPEIGVDVRDDGARWLLKKIGGAGGMHIRRLIGRVNAGPDHYCQRFIEGQTYSVVFVADGAGAEVIGYSRIWCDRRHASPFAYGGAVTLPEVSPPVARACAALLRGLVAAFDLRGLCGLDFLVDRRGGMYVLELNPRPPATFELFDDGSLFTRHLAGCNRERMATAPMQRGGEARAHALLYARESVTIPARWR